MDVASARQNASSDLKKTPKSFRSSDHVFTLGIEEELQIIDPETRELRSYIQQILADGKIILKETGLGLLFLGVAAVAGAVIYWDLSRRGWGTVLE